MRERTTWNRQAAQTKVADPYLMNQDHVSQQPKADDYVIGDSSSFAEDVHPSKDTWEAEYSGGQVKRNEIGMPEMRQDTFKHNEKSAADKTLLLKKADLCIKTASLMLRTASAADIEDQSVALMHLPHGDLINTFNRLAQQDPVAQQVQSAQQQVAQLTQQAQECIQAGDFQAAQQCLAQAAQAQSQAQGSSMQVMAQDDQGQAQGQAQQKQAQDDQGQDQGQTPQKQAQDDQSQAQGQAQQKQSPAEQAQQKQALMIQAAVKAAVDQVMQQMAQQAPVQQVAQQAPVQQVAQQAPVQQVAQMNQNAEDMALADMLMEMPGEDPMSEVGIQMDPSPMDVGDLDMGPEDDVLMTLFANDQGQDDSQASSQGQGQKQAMARTASTRTVGTRPTQGVSRVGGGPVASGGGDVNKLAALWPSAPDVSDAFR